MIWPQSCWWACVVMLLMNVCGCVFCPRRGRLSRVIVSAGLSSVCSNAILSFSKSSLSSLFFAVPYPPPQIQKPKKIPTMPATDANVVFAAPSSSMRITRKEGRSCKSGEHARCGCWETPENPRLPQAHSPMHRAVHGAMLMLLPSARHAELAPAAPRRPSLLQRLLRRALRRRPRRRRRGRDRRGHARQRGRRGRR